MDCGMRALWSMSEDWPGSARAVMPWRSVTGREELRMVSMVRRMGESEQRNVAAVGDWIAFRAQHSCMILYQPGRVCERAH